MSHFKRTFPDTKIGDMIKRIEDPEPLVLRTATKEPCCFCGVRTEWYDIESHEYTCSDRCIDYTRYIKVRG